MEWSLDRILAVVGIALAFLLFAVALGATLAMDAKTKAEMRFASGCFIASAFMLWFSIGVWGMYTQRSWWQRIPIVAICCALVGIGLVESLRWTQRRHSEAQKPRQTDAPALRSYLVVSLVIDEVSKDFMQFHFLLKNDGPLEVKVSHLVYKNLHKTAWEGSMEPVRTIIPGGELACNGAVFRGDVPGNLNVMASYKMSGFKETMTAEYGFRIREIDLHSQKVLEPTSHEEIVGEELVPSKMILDGLKQPVGSFAFWFPEKLPDGSPSNIAVSAAFTRRITFNPISRTVHLTMLSNGRLFQLDRPLLEGKQGLHYVVATWTDTGDVHLYVDGVEK
jgi:hypothetical protein